jgi:hypothetical protein
MGIKETFFYKILFVLTFFAFFQEDSHGFSLKKNIKKANQSFDRIASPFARNVKCYTGCSQTLGRSSGKALQDLCHQRSETEVLQIVGRLSRAPRRSLSKIERLAREGLDCLSGCRLKTTVKFLGRFLTTLEDAHVLHAVGVVMGLTQYNWEGKIKAKKIAKGQGVKTKLFNVVFKESFNRACLKACRHEAEQRKHFMKNIGILRQVFFEMYGPLHKAEVYTATYLAG